MESCVLDPVEFIPERVELDLDSLGLEVRAEGVDWGEGAISAQMVRQAEGESSSDGHREGVQIRIPIRVKEDGAVSLAEAAHKLQQKVGTWQEQGGWVRRDFAEEGGFAGSIGYQVIRHTAALSGLQGWLFAHRQDAPDVVLTATRMPIGYPTEEAESAVFSTTIARQLVYTLDPNSGTARGFRKIRVTNDGVADWRGLIWAEECLDAPDELTDPTAELAYLAKNLTPKGGAAEATFLGAEVIQHTGLTAGWLTILHSEILASGHMTHRGARRMWMRIYDLGAKAGNVQLRLLWRPLGASRWVEDNPIVSTYAVGDYSLVDLGLCRPQIAALGEERWEWRLLARAISGTGAILIRDVYPLPAEQYAVTSTPPASQGADVQSTKSPATAENNASAGGTAWVNPTSAKASDNNRATLASGSNATKESQYLLVKKLGFALPEAASVQGIVVGVERMASDASFFGHATDVAAKIVKGGVIGSTNKAAAGSWPTSEAVQNYGASDDLWGETWMATDINAEGFGFALRVKAVSTSLSSCTASVDAITVTVYYTEAADENRICFATRSMELRSDGVRRQHPEDDVWGDLIPDGFNPYAPTGGLEARPSRGILIPSQGDLSALADSGTPNPASVVVRDRSGYHFARGTT